LHVCVGNNPVQILRARPRYFAVRYVVKVLPGRAVIADSAVTTDAND